MLELRLKKMAYSKQLFIMLLLACSTLLLVVFKASAAHTGSASDPLPIDSEDDLYKMAECMKYNKSWSNGKHFSLNCDIELKTSIELSNGAEGYMFCGKFHGNGHTLTLSGGTPLFSTIGEGGYVENLVIKGAGYIAGENKGSIENCRSYVTAAYGIAGSNSGSIKKCNVNGIISSAGITNSNSGILSECYVEGIIRGCNADLAGITHYNHQTGEIFKCDSSAAKFELISDKTVYRSRPYYTASVNYNEGKIIE